MNILQDTEYSVNLRVVTLTIGYQFVHSIPPIFSAIQDHTATHCGQVFTQESNTSLLIIPTYND